MKNHSRILVPILWVCVVAYAAFIFWLSSLSSVPDPGGTVASGDKLFHLMLYFLFGLLLYLAMRSTWLSMPASHVIMFATLTVICYGMTDELHQSFVINRDPSIWDVFADGLGGFLGGLTVHIVRRGTHSR
jgi:VanZ family protein